MSEENLSTKMSLEDDVTAPIQDILGSINMLISAMKDSKMASEGMIDTASLDGAQAILQKTGANIKKMSDEAIKTKKSVSEIPNGLIKNNPTSIFASMKQKLSEITTGIRNGDMSFTSFRNNIAKGDGATGALLQKFKAVLATVIALKAIKEFVGWLVKSSDEMSNNIARLSLMNDGLRTNVELQDLIFKTAQDARVPFNDLASTVAKFGNNAKSAFKNTEEVVQFAGLLSKTYKMAGADANGIAAANLQISQALSMGVLRGQELNSVFEHASPVIDLIAKELGVTRGEIKAMAEEGKITAEVLTNALLNSAKEINEEFRKMPLTFQDIKTSVKDDIEKAFMPVKAKLTQIFNSPAVKAAIEQIVDMIYWIADAVMIVAHYTQVAIDTIYENWETVRQILVVVGITIMSFLIPIFIALAKKAIMAVAGMIAPLLPYILILIGVGLVLYSIIMIFQELGITGADVIGFLGMCLYVLVEVVQNVGKFIANIFIAAAEWVLQKWYDCIYGWELALHGMKTVAQGVADTLVSAFNWAADKIEGFVNGTIKGINKIIDGLNKLPNTNIQHVGTFSIERKSSKQLFDDMSEPVRKIAKLDRFEYGDLGEAAKAGEEAGRNLAETIGDKLGGLKDKIGNLKGSAMDFFNQIPTAGKEGYDSSGLPTSGVDDRAGGTSGDKALKDLNNSNKGIEENTDKLVDSQDLMNQKLDYLKDYAMRRNINSIKTDLKIEINNEFGDVNNNVDIDGMVTQMTDGVKEALARNSKTLEFI